jgi:hypothetical protein
MKVERLLALRPGRNYSPPPQVHMSGTHFCQGLSRTQGHSVDGRSSLWRDPPMILNGALMDRDSRLKRLIFKSAVDEPPDPQGSLQGEWCPFPQPSSPYPFGSPTKEPTLQVLLTELRQREMLPFRIPLSISLKIPVKVPPFSPTGTLRKELRVSRSFS